MVSVCFKTLSQINQIKSAQSIRVICIQRDFEVLHQRAVTHMLFCWLQKKPHLNPKKSNDTSCAYMPSSNFSCWALILEMNKVPIYSSFQNYWWSEENTFISAENWKHLGLTKEKEYGSRDQHFIVYFPGIYIWKWNTK